MIIQRKFFFLVLVPVLVFIMGSFNLFTQQDGEDVAIGKYRVIHSKILNEDRTLLVHLPGDYEGAYQHYPVVYMLYGNHVNTYFAEAVSILDTLGPTGRIPDSILVGIMNTDRYRDLLPLTPDGKPTGIANFVRFIREEVFPFIDKNYRTKDYRILIGPQAGANFGFYTLFAYPDLFDAYLLNNPFRWKGGRDLMIQKAKDFFKRNRIFKNFVFITYDDSDPLAREGIGYINRFSEMAANNQPEGFRLALNFIEKHDEFLQRLGLREGLKELFETYPFPENRPVEKSIYAGGIEAGISTFKELKANPQPPIYFDEKEFNELGYRFMRKGKMGDALEIFKLNAKSYPKSANAYDSLGEVYMKNGDIRKAIENYKKSLELNPENKNAREMLKKLEEKQTP